MRIKRVFDIAICLLLAPVVLPLALGVALVLRVSLGTPVMFRQKRSGYNGKPFVMYKFRTMPESRDYSGRLLPDAYRLPPLGRKLRSYSLDELPQLWNVLTGSMSLVGPRPLLPEYLPRYSDFQRRRHEVMPGLTGWAQVNGRNALTWEQKFDLDVWYVDHETLWLDAKILWMTVWQVFRRSGIAQAGHATMPEFTAGPIQAGRDV
jgi:sugar transferase EpsL